MHTRTDRTAIRVRSYVVEHAQRLRYVAELTTRDPGLVGKERAIIDAASREELDSLIAPALKAFALSVRLRQS